jgi:hypothetical protein
MRGPDSEFFLTGRWTMSSKKKTPIASNTNMQTLKIGSRVRCTDDHVEGRIVWANGVAVKITWDDGEQVTWRRDSLTDRPIEILAEHGDEDQSPATPATLDDLAQADQNETLAMGEPAPEPPAPTSSTPVQAAVDALAEPEATAPVSVEQRSEAPAEPAEASVAIASGMAPTPETHAEMVTASEAGQQALTPPEPALDQPDTHSTAGKQQRTRKPKAEGESKEKRLSAIDAAAKMLFETGQAMTCRDMIAAMAAKGYWTSPGGKTPEATLYSAVLREITTKGATSRFVKTDRGRFARTGVA